MKYIIIERTLPNDPDMVEEVPIVFPKNLVHSQVAASILVLMKLTHKDSVCTVVSAGEVTMLGLNCAGGSETLRLQSRPQDTAIISSIDYYPVRERER